ncbi:Uncharacterised protein [Bordetella pertussis]|nr:Uncharacterised protein [Bordetella pertussis]
MAGLDAVEHVAERPRRMGLHAHQVLDEFGLAARLGDFLALHFLFQRPEQQRSGQAGRQQGDDAQPQRQPPLHRRRAQPHDGRDSST